MAALIPPLPINEKPAMDAQERTEEDGNNFLFSLVFFQLFQPPSPLSCIVGKGEIDRKKGREVTQFVYSSPFPPYNCYPHLPPPSPPNTERGSL